MKQWGSLLCWRLKEEIDNRKEVGGKLDYTDSCSKAASAFFQVDICRFLCRFSTCPAFRSPLYVPFFHKGQKATINMLWLFSSVRKSKIGISLPQMTQHWRYGNLSAPVSGRRRWKRDTKVDFWLSVRSRTFPNTSISWRRNKTLFQ